MQDPSMHDLAQISHQIWDMKYRFKRPAEGAGDAPVVVDRTMEDSRNRVAEALAEVEAPEQRAHWANAFAEALDGFRFLPAGRILAGAGTKRSVTLFNCFVMGTIPDSMSGIFEALKEAALTMQQGGGIGYDFSTLRPKGAPVKGVGADASGPLSFMDVWDSMCRTIMSAGSRRGAMMATLRCDHPDIEAFIEVKRDSARLRMFNLSVLVTDPFMEAVRADADWDLVFDGAVYRTVKARALWDRIMAATYDVAEPGVIFIDRINRLNNLHYCETISATNPCVTADTWVQTSEGPRRVAELVGRPFGAVVDGGVHPSTPAGFFETGTKPVLRLTTREGHAIRLTANHRLRRVVEKTRWRVETEWVEAGRLAPGDEIRLHDHGDTACWSGEGAEGEGYLLGLLIGDGTIKSDKAVLSVWRAKAACGGEDMAPTGVMRSAETALRALGHRSDFGGWWPVQGRDEWRMSTAGLKTLAERFGMAPGSKVIGDRIERASSDFQIGVLRGLFDADGSVQGDQAKGVSVRLAQSDMKTLEAVQRMLLRLGIASTIHAERRPAGTSRLPDGRGGHADYDVKPQHELIVSGGTLLRFAERIGFNDTDKATRLANRLSGYRRAPNRERFIARIDRIETDGEEPVFDCTVPGVHAFDANGLHAHNCGEQPLPPYGACLLGSVNLATLIKRPFEPDAELDEAALAELVPVAVRMMDNVVDVSRFPLEEQAHEARAKRRIGLGVTGLADALIMVGLRYGSPEAVAATERWMALIRRHAYLASVELAREKGPFPLFQKDAYLASEGLADLDADVRAAIAEHGIRNALLTSIAPTGTISLYADNVSSGLEPVFSFTYDRTVLQPDGSRKTEEVSDFAYRLFRRLKGEHAELTPAFVDAQSLTPRDHVVMQAAVQKYIDSSISKTINCPEDIDFEAFKDVYLRAYDSGCKGCTTYRPNDVTGSVLATKREEPERAVPQAAMPQVAGGSGRDFDQDVVHLTEPLGRPVDLPGKTYKIKWPDSDHAIYITVNDIEQDGRRRPFEVFINSKNMEHFAWTVALTRMISAVFRRGGDVSFVVDELKAVFDPRGGNWVNGRFVPSLLAAIGEVIETHMLEIGFLKPRDNLELDLGKPKQVVNIGRTPAQCGSCGSVAVIKQEGCDMCTACGYSKCG
jgi:ribonucleoside-diphosphate reductase alpha chain